METKVRRPFRQSTPAAIAKRAEASASVLERDLEASLAGVALNQAMGGTKEVAWGADVDDSNARRWVRGEPQNPVNRTCGLLEKAANPFALVGFFAARATRALLMKDPMPEWRWRSLYMQAMRAEAQADGPEDVASAELLTGTGSLKSQYDADAAHVAALLKRMALGFIGMARGWSINGPHTERAH